jgi:hypothetical protein
LIEGLRDGDPQFDKCRIPYSIDGKGYDMLTPKDVLGITGTCDGRDLTSIKRDGDSHFLVVVVIVITAARSVREEIKTSQL